MSATEALSFPQEGHHQLSVRLTGPGQLLPLLANVSLESIIIVVSIARASTTFCE